MIKQYKFHDITWLDIESPTDNEVKNLTTDYNVHPLVIQELLSPSVRAKVDPYDDFIYLVLHFPIARITPTSKGESQEIDFVLGNNFLITVHYEALESLQELTRIFESNSWTNKKNGQIHAGHLFYYIIKHLYQSQEISLENINNNIRGAEKHVFAGKEREMVKVLSDVNRNLMDFRWALKYHREILNSLELAGKEFYGDKFSYYLRSIAGEYEKIWNLLENSRDTFSDLRRTNDSLLSLKIGDTTKTLTVLAFFTFTLSTMAGIMGIGAISTPVLGHPHDFWIIVFIMAAVTLGIFVVFRMKKWL